ncbi:DNA methylase [uncultured Mediterranean phage uvMED]|nr:DNA methylase [uncultured Mediterranean phage uvMED]BAR25212.1 DNA-cytosine methyltransferase [uncultured Mediterranean phage uvMED]
MSLGLEMTGGFQTVAFCERDAYCKSILRQHWPTTPIYGDVKELHFDQPVDVVVGGYPCQPFSQAGQRSGDQDDRHLWPEMARIIDETRPTWVLGENVAGHISLGLDEVLSDLEAIGYASRAFVIPAVAVDAQHRRDRVWVIAHADCGGKPDGAVNETARSRQLDVANTDNGTGRWREERRPQGDRQLGVRGEDVADANGVRSQRIGPKSNNVESLGLRHRKTQWAAPFWPIEPVVGRVAHGIPARVDRIKALGNAVVPRVVAQIGRAILSAEAQKKIYNE